MWPSAEKVCPPLSYRIVSLFVGRCVTDVVLEVDAEAGLRPGARLTVNVVESVERPQFKRDRDMEELTGAKMYDALSLSVSPRKKPTSTSREGGGCE